MSFFFVSGKKASLTHRAALDLNRKTKKYVVRASRASMKRNLICFAFVLICLLLKNLSEFMVWKCNLSRWAWIVFLNRSLTRDKGHWRETSNWPLSLCWCHLKQHKVHAAFSLSPPTKIEASPLTDETKQIRELTSHPTLGWARGDTRARRDLNINHNSHADEKIRLFRLINSRHTLVISVKFILRFTDGRLRDFHNVTTAETREFRKKSETSSRLPLLVGLGVSGTCEISKCYTRQRVASTEIP